MKARDPRILTLALLIASTGSLPPVRATSLMAPKDLGELALESDAVVLAQAGISAVEARGTLFFTTTEFEVLRALSGPDATGDRISVETPGGVLDGEGWIVLGAPEFEAGEAYLLFLKQKAGAAVWLPSALSYGILREATGTDGRPILLPAFDDSRQAIGSNGEPSEEIVPYDASSFLDQLALVLEGGANFDGGAVSAAPSSLPAEWLEARNEKAVPAGCAFFESGGRLYRWRAFDSPGGTATIYASAAGDPSLSGGGFREVRRALDVWMGIDGTSLNLLYGGPREPTLSCTSSSEDSENNLILFDDPCNDIADLQGCGGVLAFGGPRVSGTHRFDGATWITAVGWIVVVNNGAGCLGPTNYTWMLAHELGHGLGFAHTEDSGSLMYASCCRSLNDTDRTCVRYAYPPIDSANERPVANAGSDRRVRLARNSLYLGASATDDGRPGAGLTASWRVLEGPAEPIFDDAADLDSRVTFPMPGTYLLGLTVFDGQLYDTDEVEITVDTWLGSKAVVSFRQNENGYQDTVDTVLSENDPAGISSALPALRVDADSPSGTNRQVQSLLRFGSIFGIQTGQIPPGAEILAARLELTTTDAGDGASLHRMLSDWEEDLSWSDFSGDGVQAGDEAVAQADAVVTSPADAETVQVDVARSVSIWSEDPCSNFGWALLPEGTDGWSFSSSEGADPPRLTVDYSLYRPQTLVPVGAIWDYFKGTTEPAAGWTEPGFSLTADWLSGPTGIGYSDGDDATVLSDMSRGYLSIYCRREFQLAQPDRVGRLTLKIDYDDGFVAYLNGTEVARSATLASAGSIVRHDQTADSHEAGSAEEFELDPSALVAGTNVLAVQVHNERINSSDLSFIPELDAVFDLVDEGALWRFRRGSEPIPADWNQLDFDDASWELGPTGLGYGDGDDATVLTDMRNNYVSIFARRRFLVEDIAQLNELRLTVIYDDGIVVYLNGQEIGRAGMNGGAVDASTLARQASETEVATFSLPRGLLRNGENVLAVSVHNASASSSDLSFVPVLIAMRDPGRGAFCGEGILRGDANDDGEIDIGDAVRILFYLFRGQEGLCEDAADVDDSGSLESADVVSLLSFLFLGGEAPADPGISCGLDPSEDGLPACVSAACGS